MAAVTALAIAGAALAFAGALQGLSPYDAAVSWGRDLKGGGPQYAGNQSLTGLIYRAFSTWDTSSAKTLLMPAVQDQVLARIVSRVASVFVIGGVAVLFIQRAGWTPLAAAPTLERLELGIVFLATFLAAPYSHPHYYGLVAFVYILALGLQTRGGLAIMLGA